MASLYEAGWRQGSIVEANLPLDAVVLGARSGLPERCEGQHGLWVVASQDCDLDQLDTDDGSPGVELRPVFVEDPPADWGIRSWRCLLTEAEYVASASPRPLVSPAVLTTLLRQGANRRTVDDVRRPGFTKWLGLRYDRPAVPPELLPLARRIADVVAQRRHRPVAQRVRDVLVQFNDSTEPTQFALIAVLDDPVDEADVREWLEQIGRAIPLSLGVAYRIDAAPSTGISLQLIESSFATDVTQLTWRPGSPGPEGAV